MKKILVPTDFSDHAFNALQHAIEIANAFGSTIHLLHTFLIHGSLRTYTTVEQFVQENADKNLSEITKRIRPVLKNGARITQQAILGNPIPFVAHIAKDYDLTVMGTKGASGLKEVFIGSTTGGVMKQISSPLLVIPTDSVVKPVKTILLAVDRYPITSAEVLHPMQELARRWRSSTTIYHWKIDGEDQGMDPHLKDFLIDLDHSIHQNVASFKDVHAAIKDAVGQVRPDLLCMIRRKRSLLDRVFHESATLKEVYHTQLPLLILQDKAELEL